MTFRIRIKTLRNSKWVSRTADVESRIDSKKPWRTGGLMEHQPHEFDRKHNAEAVADWIKRTVGWECEVEPSPQRIIYSFIQSTTLYPIGFTAKGFSLSHLPALLFGYGINGIHNAAHLPVGQGAFSRLEYESKGVRCSTVFLELIEQINSYTQTTSVLL